MNKNDLGNALKNLADDTWRSEQKPLLLSDLPAQLKRKFENEDYKSILGTESLKSFVKNSGTDFGYQLVEHPTQRAKLGIVPGNVEYSFPVEPTKDENIATDGRATKGIVNGVALMRLLSKLPDSDLEKITIPVSVLVKLFR